MAWDAVAYHLPFAALRVGIVDSAHYQLTGSVQDYYRGFPVLGYYLKGWLWTALGRPEAPNLISVFGFLCLASYAWRAFRIPFAWASLGLAAIPAVQVSLAGNYIDLPANAFMAIFALSVCDGFARPAAFGRAKVAVAVIAATLAAHLKPQMVFQVAAVILILAAAAVVVSLRRREGPLTAALSHLRPLPVLIVGGAALVLIFGEVLYNWYSFDNPFYPVAVTIGPLRIFDGPLPLGLWPEPIYSEHYTQPYRWLLSVLEYRAFDYRRIPYTHGNGDVPTGAMSMRVGGYMGLAVLFSLVLFVQAVRVRRDATAWVFAAALAVITVCAAVIPGSHEIRYAMYWMMFLVLATMILLADGTRRLETESALYRSFLLCTLLYVVLITGGEHLIPLFRGVDYYQQAFKVEEKLEDVVHPGDTICLTHSPQLAFLYAPNFHPALAASRPYSVRSEGFSPSEKDQRSKGSSVCNWISP
jgi:hypothetical protein